MGHYDALARPPADLTNWFEAPGKRWALQHLCELAPCARIKRSAQSLNALPEQHEDISELAFAAPNGTSTTVSEMLEKTATDAFLVLHRGAVVSENYWHGMGKDQWHLIMSGTKSYVGALAGALWGDGQLELTNPVVHYLPDFAKSAFADASVRDVLDMRSGIRFSEDYEDKSSDVNQLAKAVGWAPSRQDSATPKGLIPFLLSLDKLAWPHGTRFHYRTVHTSILALILEQVGGAPIAQQLSERFWDPLNCTHDAMLSVDPFGKAYAEAGLSLTLQDWARFGQMISQEGSVGGHQVVPAAWIAETRYPDATAIAPFTASNDPKSKLFTRGFYRNQWWGYDSRRGSIFAWGVSGQTLFIDPAAEIVIAKMSSQVREEDHDLLALQLTGMAHISKALSV